MSFLLRAFQRENELWGRPEAKRRAKGGHRHQGPWRAGRGLKEPSYVCVAKENAGVMTLVNCAPGRRPRPPHWHSPARIEEIPLLLPLDVPLGGWAAARNAMGWGAARDPKDRLSDHRGLE